MRKTFVQILKDAKIDIRNEYTKLYNLLFNPTIQISQTQSISVWNVLEQSFLNFPLYFRGTCLSLEEFNQMHEFAFEKNPAGFNIDYLISFCEYVYNLLWAYQSVYGSGYMMMNQPAINVQFYTLHIQTIIDRIGYEQETINGFAVFTEKSPAARAVAESKLIPKELSYKLISYNHHSMKGNLTEKRNTLYQLHNLLEPKRDELKSADKTLESDLFYIFNNLNIRHNNIDSADAKKYKVYVEQMSKEDLEKWYDEAYQMCLLAFLQLEHLGRKSEFDKLKASIESSK